MAFRVRISVIILLDLSGVVLQHCLYCFRDSNQTKKNGKWYVKENDGNVALPRIAIAQYLPTYSYLYLNLTHVSFNFRYTGLLTNQVS